MSEFETEEQEINDSRTGVTAGVIIIGSIVDLDTQGRPLVNFNENLSAKPLIALTTLSLKRKHISRQVALLFNDGDLNQPVIMGFIYKPLDELLENFELTPADNDEASPFPESEDEVHTAAEIKRKADNQVYVDGKHVCIEGAEEVTFKCGKASITLTRSGKILIRGTYLLNRSTGVNRIMGGSVQVN
ncbi:MAG: DUF6484 domain-containing protein [Gammaproteobacteria bacterium]|nr:MAG: DUF6484 domain-containing protein [Gammaproteobacteria bacterium]